MALKDKNKEKSRGNPSRSVTIVIDDDRLLRIGLATRTRSRHLGALPASTSVRKICTLYRVIEPNPNEQFRDRSSRPQTKRCVPNLSSAQAQYRERRCRGGVRPGDIILECTTSNGSSDRWFPRWMRMWWRSETSGASAASVSPRTERDHRCSQRRIEKNPAFHWPLRLRLAYRFK